jgi:N6-adenosine-specific RNA methylase IME4
VIAHYEDHPIAAKLPLMDDEEFAALVASISDGYDANHPIWLYEGKILDGRNRYRAAQKASVEPVFREWAGGNPWSFVRRENLDRRQLKPDRKAAITVLLRRGEESYEREKEEKARAAEEARRKAITEAHERAGGAFRKGDRVSPDTRSAPDQRPSEKPREPSRSEMKRTGAQRGEPAPTFDWPVEPPPLPPAPAPAASPKRADTRADGSAKERERVEVAKAAGVSEATAARVLAVGNKNPEMLEKIAAGEISVVEATRQLKKAEVAERVASLPATQFQVIYADPPWEYGDTRDGLVGYSAAADHYPTMSLAELKALDVPQLAADDSVLFLWATAPLLPDALELARAWGFKYKAHFVWDKVRHNVGHYNSVRHELLLICTRGSCTPENVKLFDSVQVIERTEKHSEKPEEFRQIIETLYPSARKIELFRRGAAPPGWTAWGNEVKAA